MIDVAIASQADWMSTLSILGEMTITVPDVVNILARVLHILPAMILFGGMFFLRTIVVPAGNEDCYCGRRTVWARTVGICTFLLLGSGIYNFMVILDQAKEAGAEKLPPAYHMLFGIKFLLALLVMFIAAILAGKTDAAERFRLKIGKWLNIAKHAFIAIVVIAAILRTMH